MDDKQPDQIDYPLAYTAVGRESSPPIILIHGLMSHRQVWRNTLEVIKLSHYCVAPDLLGFGDSPKPEGGNYRIQAQAQRILSLADQLDFDRFELIGHSTGATIAAYIAAHLAPERVNRLVDISGVISGTFSPFVEKVVFRMTSLAASLPFLYDWMRWFGEKRFFAPLFYDQWFYKLSALPFDSWELDRRMASQRTIYRSAYQSLRAALSTDLRPYLANIKAPTQVIFGRQDASVPSTEGELVIQAVEGSRMVLIDACGHYPMFEQRDAYMEALLTFLR